MAKATVVLKKDKTCKNCVRFAGTGEDAKNVAASLYLQNAAYKELGNPGSVKITVEAAK